MIKVHLFERRPEEIDNAQVDLRQVALQSLLQVQFFSQTKVLVLELLMQLFGFFSFVWAALLLSLLFEFYSFGHNFFIVRSITCRDPNFHIEAHR